jgi:hypothetical protein
MEYKTCDWTTILYTLIWKTSKGDAKMKHSEEKITTLTDIATNIFENNCQNFG